MALLIVTYVTLRVTEAPIVDSIVMAQDGITLPRLPRKSSCNGSARIVPNNVSLEEAEACWF
jgi:hypothetical protein